MYMALICRVFERVIALLFGTSLQDKIRLQHCPLADSRVS